jgi:hypothetical protein
MPIANPLYDEWKKYGLVREQGWWWRFPMPELGDMKAVHAEVMKTGMCGIHREELVRTYAWAVPSPQILAWIAKRCKSIVEIGAGRGYWAQQLAARGVDIVAYDSSVADGRMKSNGWHKRKDEDGNLWFDVQRGGPKKLTQHADRTLFLCWPPYDNQMAVECLKHYRGQRLLYVGEWDGACATPRFFEQIEKEWHEVAQEIIPGWPIARDYLWLFERK